MPRGRSISGEGNTVGTIDDGKGKCDTDDTVVVNGTAKGLSSLKGSLIIELMVVEETIDSS